MGSVLIFCTDSDMNYAQFNLFALSGDVQGAYAGVAFNHGFSAFSTGLDQLKAATLAGYQRDKMGAVEHLDAAIEGLLTCDKQLKIFASACVNAREIFSGRGNLEELLIKRETIFKTIDFDDLYEQLASSETIIPIKDYWDATAKPIRNAGARGGLRSLQQSAGKLRQSIGVFRRLLVKTRKRPVKHIRDLAGRTDTLHDLTKTVSSQYVLWTRLIAQCACFTLCMEEASNLFLQSCESKSAK